MRSEQQFWARFQYNLLIIRAIPAVKIEHSSGGYELRL